MTPSGLSTDYGAAADWVSDWRRRHPDGRLVFTNGCFDILHVGHVKYLEAARALGDAMVIGLNTDESVRRLKGADRPVNSELARGEVLSALRCVDRVWLFHEDTPLRLIKAVEPDFLVKGGDYQESDVVGAADVKARGGQVRIIPFVTGYSTTSTLEKIRNL